jgi:uncharacterized membrane protein YfcA
LQVSVATSTFATLLTDIATGTVVGAAQVTTPAVAATLLIGAFTGSDDTQVKACGATIEAGTAQPGVTLTYPTLKLT